MVLLHDFAVDDFELRSKYTRDVWRDCALLRMGRGGKYEVVRLLDQLVTAKDWKMMVAFRA